MGYMELHTNSNAVSYHPCSLAVSQTEVSKNFVINIRVCYVLDVRRMFAIEFSALKYYKLLGYYYK
jgi:hypothetical protein